MLACLGCEWHLKSNEETSDDTPLAIERYDRIESLYLTTGDYSALLQMNKTYPVQTRTLIEDVLRLGQVNDPDINAKFLNFFRDSTLQCLIDDVQHQFEDLEDISQDLSRAFSRLKKEIPSIEMPQVYAQIGSFDQSIVVGNKTLGISLDKYLGADYPFYMEHYTEQQRSMMTRSMIIPDCVGFYILSLYPMPSREMSQEDRDMHMGKIQWVVNKVTDKIVFDNHRVASVDSFMKRNKQTSVEQLLRNNNYSELR
ncbi:MAG: gliding motility protein GldB [Prevotella sp.]|nr:gliding motility protein GldB [Prevotella sp.]MBQ8713834.1 gliding motility protein GldB [Prevotella sp.]